MAQLDILRYPDERLHTVAEPVHDVDDEVRQLVRDMAETMYAAPGIGLAATQVNMHRRVIVIDVSEARDGVQALDQIDRIGPDIIVLDLNLPGLDGYGVLSQLRSRPATVDIPVIVLTAKGDEDNEVRVFELGADDFLQKPFRARALSARLEAVLGRRRSRPA